MKKIFLSPFFSPLFLTLGWGIMSAIVLIYFPDQKFKITEDGQIIEIITNVGYMSMLASLLLLSKDYIDKITSWGIYLFLAMCAFLREAGIQHHLSKTDTTPFKSRFFLNENNPLGEKIVFGMLLLIVFAAIVYLMIKYTKHLISSFFKMNPVTWSIATFCGLAVFAKFADRFPSKWRKAHDGIPLLREQIDLCSFFEESSEMFLPYLIVIVLCQYHFSKKDRKFY